ARLAVVFLFCRVALSGKPRIETPMPVVLFSMFANAFMQQYKHTQFLPVVPRQPGHKSESFGAFVSNPCRKKPYIFIVAGMQTTSCEYATHASNRFAHASLIH